MNMQEALAQAVREDPHSVVNRSAYADWLEEHGDQDLAALHHAIIATRKCADEQLAQAQARHCETLAEYTSNLRQALRDLGRGTPWAAVWELVARSITVNDRGETMLPAKVIQLLYAADRGGAGKPERWMTDGAGLCCYTAANWPAWIDVQGGLAVHDKKGTGRQKLSDAYEDLLAARRAIEAVNTLENDNLP